MIKGIIFDWFGVCTTENWGDCVARELHKKLNVDEELIRQEYKVLLQPLMRTELSADEFLIKLLKSIGSDEDPQDFRYLFTLVPELNEELFKKILKLRQHYKIFLLSNTVTELVREYNKKINFDEYFDKTFLSNELKLSKTQDQIWDILLTEVKCAPDELIFIDNKEKYLECARRFEIKTILFESNEQLKNALESFSVAID